MKFFGYIGFNIGSEEVRPGIYNPVIVEHFYTGDLLKDTRKFISGDTRNGKLNVSNKISILADMYMLKNIKFIEYVKWNDVKWKVESTEMESQVRMNLFLGEVYKENE